MAKNLLIVESPAKAKTIEKILGEDFEVRSCYGHIRDLEKDEMGIDVKNHFKPRYIVPAEKENDQDLGRPSVGERRSSDLRDPGEADSTLRSRL